MYYKRAKEGVRVRVNQDIDQAAKGEIGTIIELRGYNFDDAGHKTARFVHVWIVNQYGHKNVCASTNILDEIK